MLWHIGRQHFVYDCFAKNWAQKMKYFVALLRKNIANLHLVFVIYPTSN